MPVQKRQCPSDNVSYDVEGRGARHTLFSSTAVLQAGNNDLDEVLAVVSATGTALAPLQVPICRWQAIFFSTTAATLAVCTPCFVLYCFASSLVSHAGILCSLCCMQIKCERQIHAACFQLSFIQPQRASVQ